MTIRTLHDNRRMRRTLLGYLLAAALLAAATAGARSANPSPLTPKLARALAVGGLTGSARAAVAVDLQTGEILYKQRRFVGMEPASNEKLPVTFAALHVLGGTYRIPTDVLGNGGQVGKTWRGNLVLRGRGDPTLSYQDLKHMAWMVRGLGIRRITGSILGDESFFDSKRGSGGGSRTSTAASRRPSPRSRSTAAYSKASFRAVRRSRRQRSSSRRSRVRESP